MFLTYLSNGNANVGTKAGAVTALRMCNPLDPDSVADLIAEALAFPQPMILVPLSGSDRTLYGAGDEQPVYGSAADGTIGRLSAIFEGLRPGGKPMWTRITKPGGAFLAVRIPRIWLEDVERVTGLILLATACQRGVARPVTAIDPKDGTRLSADAIALRWYEHTKDPQTKRGEFLNTTDVFALSQAALALGLVLDQKADVPLANNVDGDTWKAAHAAVKYFAVGLGVPCVPAIIDNTDGLTTNPVTRALLATFTDAMLALGWSEKKIVSCGLTRPFVPEHLL